MTDNRTQSVPQPSLFVGHGAPDIVISDIPARKFLRETGPLFVGTAWDSGGFSTLEYFRSADDSAIGTGNHPRLFRLAI